MSIIKNYFLKIYQLGINSKYLTRHLYYQNIFMTVEYKFCILVLHCKNNNAGNLTLTRFKKE